MATIEHHHPGRLRKAPDVVPTATPGSVCRPTRI